MAVLFIEPGTDATFDLKFYTSIIGTVTSDSGQAQTGPRSLKFDSTASAAYANASVPLPAGATLSTGQLSFAVRLPALPGATLRLASIFSTAATFDLTVSSAGVLQFGSSGTPVGPAGSSLSAGAWTHLALCWSITSTTINTLTLFVGTNGTADITASNVTLTAASTAAVTLGLVAGVLTANFLVNIDDVYLNDSGTVANPGDIRVTAKRPISLYEGGFDTPIGANPTDRWTNVNERALSETNGWAQSPNMQFARPVSDITTTGWTVFGGGITQASRLPPEPKTTSFDGWVHGGRHPQTARVRGGSRPRSGGRVIQSAPRTSYTAMWQGVNEATADDNSSYVQRAGTGTLEVKLSPLNDPVVPGDHTISARLQSTDGSGGAETATFSLVQGTTIIASAATITLSRGSYTTVTYTLTTAEANAITDYTDLRLRLVVGASGAGEHTRITQLFLQAPQARGDCPTETYQIQGWVAGDAGGDLTGTTIVGRTAWAWAQQTDTDGGGQGVYADGSLTVMTFGASPALATVTDALDKYPTANRAIGIRSSSASAVTSLYECGYLLAYLPATTTRLYLRLQDPVNEPRPGPQSAALPGGTLLDTRPLDMALALTRGASEQARSWSSLGQTGAQGVYVGRFTSPGLDAQTIAANTWSITFGATEGGANANAFVALSLYVWRPSTGAVVGYVYDSATGLGFEWGTARALSAGYAFTGGSVTCADADVLILEVWQVATQADTTSYAQNFYFDGGSGGTSTDVAAFIETPQSLSFGVGGAGLTAARFYLRNLAVNPRPSANEKSAILPVGTYVVTANGTTNEQLQAAVDPGTSQVGITWTSAAQTTQQTSYLARFTTPPLATQTINANPWTVAVATSAAATGAQSKILVSLYVYRPATGALVGSLYDSSVGLGTAWTIAETGQVVTITGAALAVLDGDLLVLEFWQKAIQTVATAIINSVYFEGSTPPVAAAAASSAASYFESPQTLLLQQFAPLGNRVVALPIKERDDG